jgi:hypothetical protein
MKLDALISHSFSPRLNVRVGYYRFFPGAYVTKTGASAPTSEFRVQAVSATCSRRRPTRRIRTGTSGSP